MQLIWLVSEDDPLSAEAVRVGVNLLAGSIGVELPADAVVMLVDDAPVGGYPIAHATGHDGSGLFVVSYPAVVRALQFAADKDLVAAGLDPSSDMSFEAKALLFLRRRFPHWPANRIHELAGALPALYELALNQDREGDD